MNTAVFSGNLGGDAVTRQTQTGESVTGFNLAVSEFKGGQESTLWIKCSMWGERGSKLQPHLRKGGKITVSGRVGIEIWQKQDGTNTAGITLRVYDVTLQGSASGGSEHGQLPQQQQQQQSAPPPRPPATGGGGPPAPRPPASNPQYPPVPPVPTGPFSDDEIPF